MALFGHEADADVLTRRRKLDARASSAHDLMLALMDFAATQEGDPCAVRTALAGTALAEMPTCQTCGRAERSCVRGLYVRGLRQDFDDQAEIERLRGQGCQIQVVEASRLEVVSPALLGALRRAIASRE